MAVCTDKTKRMYAHFEQFACAYMADVIGILSERMAPLSSRIEQLERQHAALEERLHHAELGLAYVRNWVQ